MRRRAGGGSDAERMRPTAPASGRDGTDVDPATGALTGDALAERVAAGAARHGLGSHAVIAFKLDLDKLRARGGRGREEDLVLQEVVPRVRACIRPTDLIGRLGDEDFAVACFGLPEADDAGRIAARMHQALWRIYVMDRVGFTCASTIGLTGSDDPRDMPALLGRAAALVADGAWQSRAVRTEWSPFRRSVATEQEAAETEERAEAGDESRHDDAATDLRLHALRVLAAGTPPADALHAIADRLSSHLEGAGVRAEVRRADGTTMQVRAGDPTGSPANVTVGSRSGHSLRITLTDLFLTAKAETLAPLAHELMQLARVVDAGTAVEAAHADVDRLTRLGNSSRVRSFLAAVADGNWAGTHAVIYVDIDDQKRINDRYGLQRGDQAIIETARRLGPCLRPTDVLARMGGDEFVAVCMGLPGPDDAVALATRMKDAVAEPLQFGDDHVDHSATFIVAVTQDATELPDLVDRAFDAARSAKLAGKNRVVRWSPPA